MTAAERNRHLRDLANSIAAELVPVLGLRAAPKCARITRRRGRSYGRVFSVPLWAAKHTDYFVYYVAHEVCHAVTRGHGPLFRQAEQKALAHFNLLPRYAKGGAGPYINALLKPDGKTVIVTAVEVGACPKQHAP